MPIELINGSAHGARVCGVPDHLGGGDCLWPFQDITVYVPQGAMLGQVNLRDAFEEAISGPGSWNQNCGTRLVLVTNQKTAHGNVRVAQIDGPQKVLAMSELPCGGFTATHWRQLGQTYEPDAYVIAENPPQGRLDAVRVIRHEVGHFIGISHINDGNLMAPTYSNAIRGVQRGDIMEAVTRYGKPMPAPTPEPQPPAPSPGPGPDIWRSLLPCLLKYGIDIFSELTPEERKRLIQLGLKLFRNLTPDEQKIIEQLRAIDQPGG